MNNFFIALKKWFLLGSLLCMLFIFFYFQLYRYLNFHTLKTYQSTIQQWTVHHYKLAVVLYLFIFIVLIACTIPCATLLTLIGGFLFGGIAVIYAVLGTALGGTVLFLAVRSAIGSHLKTRTNGWIKQFEQGFQQNAFNYLLMLRLMPIFPCWISNISAGALNVPLKTFMSATVIGIFPATFIYAMAGRGLDKLLITEQTPNLNLVFTPSIFFPLCGLAILSIFPVFYKRVKKQDQDR
ncbi:TVP38/TMEM64 family protein [Aquicella lusitana]|uniref:TVP38/TMEM64 family membrane protein n=2 Tax=Aquicella lusitana TaxID=254246 RepID=A0A370GJ06_9COXI|nr:VTT domain-containing protein [Aquicella lusitana]RDI43768.1 putative membrane protein YdjX (TVP38/TMEM64 family) [Aquicella lusitana]VVC74501.1 hypothetical protein AQULUS_22670 [Aquicella lusitana]